MARPVMLRVLTLSTLFPDASQPTLGVFVERQTLGLAARPDVELQVVAPVGLPVWPLSRHTHYAARSRLPFVEQHKGLTVHRPRHRVWPKFEGGTARAMARTLLPRLRALRESFPFDVIDAEFFWPDGPAAMELARALNVPFSIKARGADIQYWGYRPGIAEQVLAAGQAADGLLAVSKAMKAVMAGLGMAEDRIRVHHTGVDLDRFEPRDRAAAKAALGIDGPLIVTAGALIPRKGQKHAIAVLELIQDAILILVGEGPDRRALEEIVRDRGLGDRVRLLGNRPHAELPGLLAAADVMLLPTNSEGLANVWVEALACGTPVVTTDVGGAREVIDRPDAGRIADLDPVSLATAVRDVLAHPPDRHATRRAAGKFSWERNSDELFQHLSSLVRAA